MKWKKEQDGQNLNRKEQKETASILLLQGTKHHKTKVNIMIPPLYKYADHSIILVRMGSCWFGSLAMATPIFLYLLMWQRLYLYSVYIICLHTSQLKFICGPVLPESKV